MIYPMIVKRDAGESRVEAEPRDKLITAEAALSPRPSDVP